MIKTEDQIADLIARVKVLESTQVKVGAGTLSAADPNTQTATLDLNGVLTPGVPVIGNYIPEATHQVPFILNGNQPVVFAPTKPLTSAAPAQVTGVTVTPGIGSLVVRWASIVEADVKWNRGYYQVQVDTVNTFDSVNLKSADQPGTSHTITGLITDTLYYVRVRAIDYVGTTGAWSSTASGTPIFVGEVDVDFSLTGIEVVDTLPTITPGSGGPPTITGTIARWSFADLATITHSSGSVDSVAALVGSVPLTATGSARPITGTRSFGPANRNVLDFNGTSHFLQAAITNTSDNQTVVFIGLSDVAADGNHRRFCSSHNSGAASDHAVTSGWPIHHRTSTDGYWIYNNGLSKYFRNATTTTAHIVTATYASGGVCTIYVDNVAGGTSENNGVAGLDVNRFYAGAGHDNSAGGPTAFLNGWLGEIWVFDHVLTTQERDDLNAYLDSYWVDGVDPGPGNYPEGTVVFLTTDDKLYRSTGTAWTAAVPAVDITGQITTTQITDDAITTPKIAANAVTAAEIAANTITANEIASNAVTADEIAAGTITAAEIAANTITAAEIATGAITTDEILANTILAGDIAANTITAGEIAANAITTSELNADSVTAAKLAALNLEVGKYIRSTSYVAGTSGWTINADGFAEFGNVLARGIVEGTFIKGSTIVGVIGSNLITNPGAETNTTGWTATNCTLTRTTTAGQFRSGVGAFNLSCTTGGTDMSMHTPTGTSGFPVQHSVMYSATAFFRSAATSRKCRIDLRIYDAGGSLINTYSAEYDDYVNHWRGIQVSSHGPLSVNARFASVLIAIETPAGSEVHRVDDINLFPASAIFTDIETGPSGAPRVAVYSDIVPQILFYNGTDGEAAGQVWASNALNGQDVDRKILSLYSGYPSGGNAGSAVSLDLRSAGVDSGSNRWASITTDRLYFFDADSTTVGMVHEENTAAIGISNSTTSTLPVEPTNVVRVTVKKRHQESHFLIRMGVSNIFMTGGLGGRVEIGVHDGTTYYPVARGFLASGASGIYIGGEVDILFNTGAGTTYTFQWRWLNSNGNTISTDTNSSMFLSVMECSP